MAYEAVVVGGGFGGLTVAALLAARGVNVCLIEKESRPGGCASTVEKFGYSFETSVSMYTSWGAGDIHERVFSELALDPPEVRRLSPAYVVRLPDGTDFPISANREEFDANLAEAFPECFDIARAFYAELEATGDALRRVLVRVPDLPTASRTRRLAALGPELRNATRLLTNVTHTVEQHLVGASNRFRRFVDVQLQTFGQCESKDCAFLYAAVALTAPLRGMYDIVGGAGALADTLVESIRKAGGTVRLDTNVLRAVLDAEGNATGVDLLSGERIDATRAVISNLTVWDTYGKLVGLARTPTEVRNRLKPLRGLGAYLMFLGMNEPAVDRLPSERLLCLRDWQEDVPYDPETAQFVFSAAPAWNNRAPEGKRAVTVATYTDPEQWFSFHEDDTELETQDQNMLEQWWERLHVAMPELGSDIEVIETASPRTFYETTRRKLGMIGGVGQSLDVFGFNSISHRTVVPRLYMVGDTTFPGQGIAAVTHSAMIVANEITKSL